MKQTLFVSGICLLFASGLAPAASITGTVVDDATGMAVSSAEVKIYGLKPPAIDLPADGGTFQSGDLRSGDYTVSVWGPGYVSTSISMYIGDWTARLPVRLVRLGPIEGQLTGLQGWTARVLALARSLDRKTGKETWKPVLEHATRATAVDADGRFRIPDLPPGSYSLLVAYSNSGVFRYPDGKGVLELKADGAAARVQIPVPAAAASRTVEEQVVLPDPRSWYWLTLSNPANPALAVATTVSNDKGAFAFRGVVPGNYEVLAVPGTGEPGTVSAGPPYHGFARVGIDLRMQDVRGVRITPQDAVTVSVTLEESVPAPDRAGTCLNGITMVTPLEDWGVQLERSQGIRISNGDTVQWPPEAIDGLAPAKYGVSVDNLNGCLVGDNPVLDLTKVATGSVEEKMKEPGAVTGQAEDGSEIILIPEDFTEGWSYLPAYWFDDLPFGAQLHFRQQALFGSGSGPYLPHVRIAIADFLGHFQFTQVPAGRYSIGFRAPGPAPNRATMKQIDVPPSGIVDASVEAPDTATPTTGR